MASVLYVGDSSYPVATFLEHCNHSNPQRRPWAVDEVPNTGEFHRGKPEGLRSWLRGKVHGRQPQPRYDAIIVEYPWWNLVPVVKEVHPNTPMVMLLAPPDVQIEGVDVMLRGIESVKRLPETLETLVAAKR